MQYRFDKMTDKDRSSVIDIFNHFIDYSFAAYPEDKVSYDFFDVFLKMTEGYPAITVKHNSNNIIGFAFLHAYHPLETFSRAAEITYFIMPEYTDRGIGTAVLEHLVEEARAIGIDSIFASISSFNKKSITFHLKNGFKECGRFLKVGKKFGDDFDLIWMQKMLD